MCNLCPCFFNTREFPEFLDMPSCSCGNLLYNSIRQIYNWYKGASAPVLRDLQGHRPVFRPDHVSHGCLPVRCLQRVRYADWKNHKRIGALAGRMGGMFAHFHPFSGPDRLSHQPFVPRLIDEKLCPIQHHRAELFIFPWPYHKGDTPGCRTWSARYFH